MGDLRRLAARALVFALFLVSPPAPAAAAEAIRIGAFLPVTGAGAALGAPALATLRLYIERINQQGGVLGRRLKLVLYDTGLDAARAQTAVRRLIDVDKVDVIIGGATTGASMAVIPIVEQARVPFLSLAASVSVVEPVKKWVFKIPPTDRMACAAIFADMKKRDISRVALLSGRGGFGRSMRHQCLALAAAAGIEFVADVTYAPGARDFSGSLRALAAVPGVEAILNAGFGEAPAVITRAFARLGPRLAFYQSHGAASERFLGLAGAAAGGVRLPVPAILVAGQLRRDDPQRNVLAEYRRIYKEKWGLAPAASGAHAYDALQLAVAAIRRAGGTEREALRAAIEATDGYVGATGRYKFSPQDHLGLGPGAFRMVEIRSGAMIIVD